MSLKRRPPRGASPCRPRRPRRRIPWRGRQALLGPALLQLMTRMKNNEHLVFNILLMNNFYRFQKFRQLFSNLFSQIRLKKRHTSVFSGIRREFRTNFIKIRRKNCKIRDKK